MTPFPWQSAMRIGLGTLRLPPAMFWAMTPRELAAAISGLGGMAVSGAPLHRSEFEALIARYPDIPSNSKAKTAPESKTHG